MIHYSYSDTEIKKILETLTIIIDSREKANDHITSYFEKHKKPFVVKTLNVGDYGCFIPKNDELGIKRDIHLNSFIERKSGVNEITGNLQKDKVQAFINELIRSQNSLFILFVEEEDFWTKVIRGDYISQYNPKALYARLLSFEAKYNFTITPIQKSAMGSLIYHRFYYQMKHYLERGVF